MSVINLPNMQVQRLNCNQQSTVKGNRTNTSVCGQTQPRVHECGAFDTLPTDKRLSSPSRAYHSATTDRDDNRMMATMWGHEDVMT